MNLEIIGNCPHCKNSVTLSRPITSYETIIACLKSIFEDPYVKTLGLSAEEKKDIAVSLFINATKGYK